MDDRDTDGLSRQRSGHTPEGGSEPIHGGPISPSESRRPRILVLEDSDSDAFFMLRELQRAGYLPEWDRAQSEAEFLAKLSLHPDLIIADSNLAGFGKQDALSLVKERRAEVPVIVVSGAVGEDWAEAALRQGASDYVPKDHLRRLGPVVQQTLERQQRRDRPLVYIVDNGADQGTGLAFCLQTVGYPVHLFLSPLAAVAALGSASSPKPALIITDLQKRRPTAAELLRQCRERVPALKAIVVQGPSSTQTDQECGGAVLRKPFTYKELTTTVARVLAER